MKREGNHARNKEQEYRQQFEICSKNRTPAGLTLVFSGERTLHNELVGTPVPETYHSRTHQSAEPGEIGIAVVADQIGHGVAIFVGLNRRADAHHFIPAAELLQAKHQYDKRTQKQDGRLEHRCV